MADNTPILLGTPESIPVDVVIPAANASATLGAAVASALAQTGTGPLTVTIAINPADEATMATARALVQADPRVAIVENESGATPIGLNRAIGVGRAPVVARLDAHAVLPDSYVRTAVQTLIDTQAANVGGMQIPVADVLPGRAIAAAMRSPVGAGGAAHRVGGDERAVETVYLGVFRRWWLHEVGGFDPFYKRAQDYELNHRLREAGGVVYFTPALQVEYTPRATYSALARQYWDYGRYKRKLLERHDGAMRPRQMAPPVLLAALGAGSLLSLAGESRPLRAVLGAWLAACIAGAAKEADRPADIPLVAAALATMHASWGMGFLVGTVEETDLTPAPSDRTVGSESGNGSAGPAGSASRD